MASGLLTSERNISLYTIPAVWILAIVPHIVSISLSNNKFDNRQPRNLNKSIENDQSLDKDTKAAIFRATSASQNGLENVGLYASAIVAGNMAGLSVSTLNGLSVGYVASRAVYNVLYLGNTTQERAAGRTATFWVGIGIVMSLFGLSGSALNDVGRGLRL